MLSATRIAVYLCSLIGTNDLLMKLQLAHNFIKQLEILRDNISIMSYIPLYMQLFKHKLKIAIQALSPINTSYLSCKPNWLI